MTQDLESKLPKPTSAMSRFLIYAGVLLVAFLLGFVPMWFKARAVANKLAETQHQLTLVAMQSNLGSAVIYSRRGDYETARQAASQFFTTLREEVDKGEASSFSPAQREAFKPMFVGRDELITLLARSDPASADRLSDLFVAYRKITSG